LLQGAACPVVPAYPFFNSVKKKLDHHTMQRYIIILFLLLSTPLAVLAQEQAADTTSQEGQSRGVISELKYIKQPGFANASSKIFSADERYSISGFGEINYINYSQRVPNKESKEIEQYYSNLYRLGTYFGYKLTDKIIFMSEVQLEYLHDGFREGHFESNIEASFDFLLSPYFNVRVGNYPLVLGWVNVNEEPIAFYTVNRPEVERIIVPTQWLEQGVNVYGNIVENLEYHFGVTKGLDATGFTSGTWIRNGRYTSWTSMPKSFALNGKLQYGHEDNMLFAVAGYHGDASAGHRLQTGDRLRSNLSIMTALGTYNFGNLSLFGLYSRGWVTGTDQIYSINNEIVGAETEGYYLEARYNILPLLQPTSSWKLPLFVRYERLDTHRSIEENLTDVIGSPNAIADLKDLEIISVGLNVRPKKSITLKADYQFRQNKREGALEEPNQMELGIGFIF
jgi:hypothetical protein